MTAPKFAFGMLFVLAVVAVWSVVDSAPWTTILLRLIVGAVVLQVGYFVIVLGMVAKERKPAKQDTKAAESERPGKVGESNLSR